MTSSPGARPPGESNRKERATAHPVHDEHFGGRELPVGPGHHHVPLIRVQLAEPPRVTRLLDVVQLRPERRRGGQPPVSVWPGPFRNHLRYYRRRGVDAPRRIIDCRSISRQAGRCQVACAGQDRWQVPGGRCRMAHLLVDPVRKIIQQRRDVGGEEGHSVFHHPSEDAQELEVHPDGGLDARPLHLHCG